MEYQHTPKTGKFQNGKSRYFEMKLNTHQKPENSKMENPVILKQNNKGKTLIIFFVCFSSVAEMMIDESDSDFDNMHEHDEYSHSEIIHRCNFGSKLQTSHQCMPIDTNMPTTPTGLEYM